MRAAMRALLVVAALAALPGGSGPGAQGPPGRVTPVPPDAAAPHGYPCRTSVQPGFAHLGERVLYRGRVLVPRDVAFRWSAPVAGGAFEWGSPQSRRVRAYKGSRLQWGVEPADTVEIEVPLQAFALGMLSVPGLGFEVREAGGRLRASRLPVVRLGVVPRLSPQRSDYSLRPVRGPLGAPWWERVPWGWVGTAALALGLLLVLLWLRRRARAAPPAPAVAPPGRHPGLEALDALGALRRLTLPDQGRFAEHAFHLTRILRRFLERTEGTPRPGDTSAELVRRLSAAQLGPPEVERVAALLASWDRVKFARAASSVEEAQRTERAVEELVRRRLPVERKEAA